MLIDYEVVSAVRGLALGGALSAARAEDALTDFDDLAIERWTAKFGTPVARLHTPTQSQRRRRGIRRAGRIARLPVDHPGRAPETIQRPRRRHSDALRDRPSQAGFSLGDVMQLRIVTTDIAAVTANYDVITEILADADCRPASLMAEVAALSDPAMMVGIEALAAQ
ncbi:hypothetical protein FOE78_04290 [Microlunatus elymi]|uniref:Uncharacterized protein n=1 Tax=Microlunatus elymi TaxID=2596828 RepID=A0A516Q5V6_9ACTN|nr:hypothetical protein FOE78_04290 [Microlunatus elymi]